MKEHQAVAAISPVLAIVELVLASEALFAPVFGRNRHKIIVASLARLDLSDAGSGNGS